MSDFIVRSAVQRREDIQARAAAMGIDEAYISVLVDTFYDRIRADKTLGPIFGSRVKNWDTHLPNMKAFWASVALSAGQYSGRPMPVHQKLRNDVQPAHFQHWLTLFEQTLNDTAPTKEAVPYFLERAERIAKSLQLGMFGDPDIPPLSKVIPITAASKEQS